MAKQKAEEFVRAALCASIFADARSHGLTEQELIDVGERHGRRPGELRDALQSDGAHRESYGDDCRWRPRVLLCYALLFGGGVGQPFMPPAVVLDFVIGQFKKQSEEVGIKKARLTAATVVARGEAAGYLADHLHAALVLFEGEGHLALKDGSYWIARKFEAPPFVGRALEEPRTFIAAIEHVLPTVRDVMSRRAGDRPPNPDSIRAFQTTLKTLGYPHLQQWWSQISGELSRADEQDSKVTVIVLSAALGEAALTCVAERAWSSGKTMTRGLPEKRQSWKFETLIDLAKTGQGPIIV